jgi:hypothetical protein
MSVPRLRLRGGVRGGGEGCDCALGGIQSEPSSMTCTGRSIVRINMYVYGIRSADRGRRCRLVTEARDAQNDGGVALPGETCNGKGG